MRATKACSSAVKTALVSSIDGMNAEVLRRLKGNSRISVVACDILDNIQSGQLREAEVIFADPPTFAKTDYIDKLEAPKLKFFQSTFAGCDAMFKKDRSDYTLCRASGVMGPEIAQYVLTHILAIERKYDLCKESQIKAFWNHKEARYRSHKEVTIGILGVSGDIGTTIAKFCSTVGFKIVGWQRQGKMVPHVSHTYTSMDDVLARSDYIVNILPSTELTRGLLDNQALSACQNENTAPPVFINVGRGDVVCEESIIEALDKRWLGQCVLDVFPVEPLSKDSKLWDRNEVLITPHVAGLGFPDAVADIFCTNIDLYVNQREEGKTQFDLNHVFDWEKGY